MAVIKIAAFGGMIPAVDDRLLPDTASALSQNCYLYTGQLVGIVAPKFVRDMDGPDVGKAYRIPNNYYDAEHIEDAFWMEFQHIDTDIIRSPVVGDTHDRYYWASPIEPPQVNSAARIKAEPPLPSFNLGVIQPTGTPTITSMTGGVGSNETRAYVITWNTAFDEEGPPSSPVVGTGKIDDTWTLSLPVAGVGDIADYNLANTRIYRTVASGGATSYFYVGEVPIGTTTYADSASTAVVSSNEILSSMDWIPPPPDLEGFVSMPNGMLAGWKGSELWFSEPFRPHAWPAAYTNSVEYPIIGLGVTNQTLVICTAGYPIVATGIHPDSISMSKLASFEPCMSRGSILSVPEGVFYASPNGLVLVANGVAKLVTEGIIQRDEWNLYNQVSTMRATRMGSAYYSFGSSRPGFTQISSDPAFDTFQSAGILNAVQLDDFAGSVKGILMDNVNQRVAFNTLHSGTVTVNVFNDAWSGETLIIRDNKLYRIDLADLTSVRDTAIWRSKIFQAPDKKNFAAMRVYFEIPPWAPETFDDKIPPMTSATTGDVTMTASSEYPGWPAWYAGRDSSLYLWSTDTGAAYPHILTVDFGNFGSFIAAQYTFIGVSASDPAGPGYAPKDWTFEGSTDGVAWVVLDTQTAAPPWIGSEIRTFPLLQASQVPYRYFRLVVTLNHGGLDNFVTIGSLHIAPASYGTIRVYADDRLILTRELHKSSELMRLPSGFKADYWQIEIETAIKINSVQMATSVKELLKG
jgi:hypothetical protein